MVIGIVNGALKLLTNVMANVIVSLNDGTLTLLQGKHPKAKSSWEEITMILDPPATHPVSFEERESVNRSCVKTKDRSGPSGLDAGG